MDIITYTCQELAPAIITHDSRGNFIKEGATVAYNYQGSVKLGKIISCSCKWKVVRKDIAPKSWWSCVFELKILNEEGFTSTVKNPNSFLIIP